MPDVASFSLFHRHFPLAHTEAHDEPERKRCRKTRTRKGEDEDASQDRAIDVLPVSRALHCNLLSTISDAGGTAA